MSKKKFCYSRYILKVLNEVSPYNGINLNAKKQLDSALIIISDLFVKTAIKLVKIGNKKKLTVKEISNTVKILLTGELMVNTLLEGEKAVNTFREKDRRQKGVNIIFPASIAEKYLRWFGLHKIKIGTGTSIYFAAIIEYITAEILELASDLANNNKKIRITVANLKMVILNDVELKALFDKLHIFFITERSESLLKSKKRKKETGKKSNFFIFPRYTFEKLIRKIANQTLRISKDSIMMMQYFVENYLADLLRSAKLLSKYSNRAKLISSDILLIQFIRENKDIRYLVNISPTI